MLANRLCRNGNEIVSDCSSERDLLLAFYSDDFTGATDALECLASAGVNATVYLRPPTLRELHAAEPHVAAIGVAGCARSLPTGALAQQVRPALAKLRDLGARHVHYKVCSTFDSSPAVGSIGRVIDEAAHVFDAPFVPLIVGTPRLGRWCVFGNLFAQHEIGSTCEVFRLDRHPTMQNHPITPADESDLRRHLARQTSRSIALFDFRQLELPLSEASATFQQLLARKPQIVLFDVLQDRHLATIGALIDRFARSTRPLFSVGSSGVETALTSHWAATGRLQAKLGWPEIVESRPIIVVSGSCSPVTAAQIEDAVARGFGDVPFDTESTHTSADSDRAVVVAVEQALQHLAAGRSVVVHTSRGPDDPRLTRGRDARQSSAVEILGSALGRVLVGCLDRYPVRRACVAGGDTSSYVATAIGIQSITMISPLTRGAPLCRVNSMLSVVDGLEVVFKGGQVGSSDFFLQVAEPGK